MAQISRRSNSGAVVQITLYSRARCQIVLLGAVEDRRVSRSARIAVAAALLLGGTSLAMAKTRGSPARTAIHLHPGINETVPRPIVADPYYRLSDRYYGHSDPLQGLFDFYAVPPFSPGYSYSYGP